MENELFKFFALSASIGSIVFLVQQTDFIYEYASLFLGHKIFKKIRRLLNFEGYENSNQFENYIMFLGSVYGIKKNILGFICRLLTCFICLNCFLSFFSVLFITKSILIIFPCFLLSIVTFYILFLIKKSVFK